MKTRALLATAICLAALSARADDWPQWRGPHRDNVSREKGLLAKWPAAGPKLLWTYKEGGTGYSGPAIVGDTLYTMGARGADEYLIALDLTKNPPAEKWPAVKIGPTFTWKGNNWNKGPSATPTVAGDQVYALGGFGELVCVTTAGAEKWRKSLVKNLKGQVDSKQGGPDDLGWGYTSSPLVEGDNVICMPGGPDGIVAALNAKTGEVVWQSKDLTGQATYTSPVAAKIGGKQQYVVMVQDGVAGVDAKDGAVLWRYQREEAYGDILASTPIVMDDLVFITGIKGGSELVKVKAEDGKFTAEKAFNDRKLENFLGGMALLDGVVYGCNSGLGGRADWFALSLKGKPKIAWRKADKDVPKGSLTCADGKLYLLSDEGEVGLADASPKEWNLISHFLLPEPFPSKLRPIAGKVWTPPVVANGKLYLRDQELIFCYEVK